MMKNEARRAVSSTDPTMHASSSDPTHHKWSLLLDHKLYDRDVQKKALQDAYRRSHEASWPELVLITGASGTGKSALAMSLKSLVEQQDGLFISGKSDDQVDTPHGPFVAAVEDLVDQLLLLSSSDRNEFREAVAQAVGADLAFFCKAIPYVRRFLQANSQQQNPLDESCHFSDSSFGAAVSLANEDPSRFVSIFCRFLRSICEIRHVTILLDDLQWLDPQSLFLLETLLLDPATQEEDLLLLGTCRGNEVGQSDRLAVSLRRMEEEAGVVITDIQVQNLSVQALDGMIADALELPEAFSLAQVVQKHTKGNVFFAKHYLRRLVDDGVVYRDSYTKKWRWDDTGLLQALAPADPSGDLILPLLVQRLQKLPVHVIETLQTMGCMGSTFSRDILVHAVLEAEPVEEALQVAAEQGFIEYNQDTKTGHFVHDKFREAPLSMIAPEQAPLYRLTIGRNLRRQLTTEHVKANILIIVDQLKCGLELVTDPEELDDFSRLFLWASKQVAKRSAYVLAAEYVDYGISILSRRHWRDQYNLSLALYSAGAELAYCNGEHEKLAHLANAVFSHAQSIADKSRAQMAQLISHDGVGLTDQGTKMCRQVLEELKVPFPRNPGPLSVLVELVRVKCAIGRKTEEDILSLPTLEDQRVISAMQVLFVMFYLVVSANLDWAPIPAFRMVRLTLQHGLSPLAAHGFHLYGMVLVKLGNIEDGYRFGRLALQLLEKFPSKALEAKIGFLHLLVFKSSKFSYRSILDPLWDAGIRAWEAGDMEHALGSGTMHSSIRLLMGDPLPEVSKVLTRYVECSYQYRHYKVGFFARGALQACHNLQGMSNDPLVLTGQYLDEEDAIQECANGIEVSLCGILHFKMMMAVVLNDNEAAHSLYQTHRASFKGSLFPFLPLYQKFFRGMVAATLARTTTGRARTRHLAEVGRVIKKLRKLLVHCPDNVAHKIDLIEAELEFCHGRYSSALLKYDKAISVAELRGFVSVQALACEKAARMLTYAGRKQEATSYFRQAHMHYMAWGAQVKVDQLDLLMGSETLEAPGAHPCLE
ncbi:expressed unknown protein [Seminavis robusta]|uniref:Orc1-like AAA ATPase domain-containing protein n=1 Tax=Seminavis robusta TaxID=568900 RepID=A0A9N8HIN3_9STRA|nr:expressed unknown protein [Seminavis robusta]|eukprot:Sro796_g203800.1 n/a (1046) ;mRNA; f:37041-40386